MEPLAQQFPISKGPVRGQTTFAFLIATARSGTNLLRSILAQEPAILSLGEVFNQDLARNIPHNFTDFLSARLNESRVLKLGAYQASQVFDDFLGSIAAATDKPIALIDVKDRQLRILDWPPIRLNGQPHLLRFIQLGGFPIIRLTRRDWLSQYASLALASVTRRWVVRATDEPEANPTRRLRLDTADVLEWLTEYAVTERMMRVLLADRERVTWLTYESLLEGSRLSNGARTEVERSLGLRLSPHHEAGTLKIAPPLRQLVENLDEVLAALAGTPFEWLREQHKSR